MSYEKRGLRPFDVLDKTQTLLNQLVKLQSPPIPDGFLPPMGSQGLEPLGIDSNAGSIAGANGTLTLDQEQFRTNAVGLYFGVNDEDWRHLIDTLDDELSDIFGRSSLAPVSIVVTATNTRLKQQVLLLRETYGQFVQSDSWRRLLVPAGDTADRARPFRMPQDGCIVTVQFVLHEDLPVSERQPGRPWRKGSWLAKIRIKVSAARGSGLAPRFLTEQLRRRLGVGDRSSSYVDLRADTSGLHLVTDLSEVMSVFIDEEALKKATELKPNGEFATPAGEALVLRWVMDTYRALVHAFRFDDRLDEFDPDVDEHRHTYLYGLLQQVSEYGDVTIDEALNILKDQPNRFVALIENSLDLNGADGEILRLRK